MKSIRSIRTGSVLSNSTGFCRNTMIAALFFVSACGGAAENNESDHLSSKAVPSWAADAIIYQIFPERFRNGDPTNDPTRASLEYTREIPENWKISSWTADWYAREDWEYEISDSFYGSVFDRRYGGDLLGVIKALPYLDSLGINVIYFNPVFWARSLHKYDGNTFHHIDPNFGPDPEGDFALMATETADPATWNWTRADQLFLGLVSDAHILGMRIIIDGVWNHTGQDFFAFADIRENQEDSPYKDWYIINSFDDPDTEENEFDYEGWWGVKTLPLFADQADGQDLHAGPKAYVFDATSRWMDPNGDGNPKDGIDGWRLGVANEVPMAFWEDWNAHVRALNPNAYTVAEVWDDAVSFLRDGGFSATMNYHAFAFPVKGYLIDGSITAEVFVELTEERSAGHDEARRYAMMNLVDSHDTDRLASMIVNADSEPYLRPERFDFDESASGTTPMHTDDYSVRRPIERERFIQRLVALVQMTWVGAPTIYYGTEAGMWGADDPDDRMPMTWPDMNFELLTHDPIGRERISDEADFDQAIFGFYQAAVSLRRETQALRRGEFRITHTKDQFLAFERQFGTERILVLINRSEEPVQLALSGSRTNLGQTEDWQLLLATREISAEDIASNGRGIAPIIQMPGLTGAVFKIDTPATGSPN